MDQRLRKLRFLEFTAQRTGDKGAIKKKLQEFAYTFP